MNTRTLPSLVDEQPLAGLTVIELDAIGPGPFAGRHLVLLGADVTRIRPPVDRSIGLELDASIDLLNHDKQVERINLKSDTGREALLERLERTDVMLEGFRPGVLERLGLAPETTLARCPQLVIGRLPGWGTRGPLADRAGHDINYLALSGLLATIGTVERPVLPGNLVADLGGGAMHLLVGVLAALVRRGIDGRGSVVETSLLAGTVGLSGMLHELMANGHWQQPRESNILDGGAPFYRVYATRDKGFVAVGALEARFFAELLNALSLTDVIDAARQWDRETWPVMSARFEAAFKQRDRDTWARQTESLDACVTPVLSPAEAMQHAQLHENALVSDDPVKSPGIPWRVRSDTFCG